MPADYEACKDNLDKLADWVREHPIDANRNEATTRFQLIDRLLLECLGWFPEDCTCEDRLGGTFADYTLGVEHKALVVEAKKVGIYFELPSGFSRTKCKISTLVELDKSIGDAIAQAAGYCKDRGIAFGAVCNGWQLIGFIGSRADGVAPMDGDAIVFGSLESMRANFPVFWKCFSRPGAVGFGMYQEIQPKPMAPAPAKLSEGLLRYPGFKNRNANRNLGTFLEQLEGFVLVESCG